MPKITPKKYVCPLSKELIVDPVVAADGEIYEKREIKKWLKANNVSPVTKEQLKHKKLIAVPFIVEQIKAYQKELGLCSNEEFIAAVKTGDIAQVDKLNFLTRHVNLNYDTKPYEPIAPPEEDHPYAKILAQEALDLDMESFTLSLGTPLLFYSIMHHHTDMAAYLLKQGANPNAALPYNGWTVLHTAVSKNCPDIVKLLLDHGAKPDTCDWGEQEECPLMLAAENGLVEIVKLLDEAGAKTGLEEGDTYGHTALDVAVQNGQREVVDYLAEHHPEMAFLADEKGASSVHLAIDALKQGKERRKPTVFLDPHFDSFSAICFEDASRSDEMEMGKVYEKPKKFPASTSNLEKPPPLKPDMDIFLTLLGEQLKFQNLCIKEFSQTIDTQQQEINELKAQVKALSPAVAEEKAEKPTRSKYAPTVFKM